ncbi:hypothetical protein KRM28CT15_27840 [Krasilnikovia sp. M28-CT-15]
MFYFITPLSGQFLESIWHSGIAARTDLSNHHDSGQRARHAGGRRRDVGTDREIIVGGTVTAYWFAGDDRQKATAAPWRSPTRVQHLGGGKGRQPLGRRTEPVRG